MGGGGWNGRQRVEWEAEGRMGGGGWNGRQRVEWEAEGGMGGRGWNGRRRVEWEAEGGMGGGGWNGRRRVEWEAEGRMGGREVLRPQGGQGGPARHCPSCRTKGQLWRRPGAIRWWAAAVLTTGAPKWGVAVPGHATRRCWGVVALGTGSGRLLVCLRLPRRDPMLLRGNRFTTCSTFWSPEPRASQCQGGRSLFPGFCPLDCQWLVWRRGPGLPRGLCGGGGVPLHPPGPSVPHTWSIFGYSPSGAGTPASCGGGGGLNVPSHTKKGLIRARHRRHKTHEHVPHGSLCRALCSPRTGPLRG